MSYQLEHNDLKFKSDLMTQIATGLTELQGDLACKLGINPERLDELQTGKIDRFRLMELQSLARRAGVQPV
jgi:predicted XRE-type DNA-binding protein